MTSVSFRLLGTFELAIGGTSIPISSRRGRALLAYLVLQPTCAESREHLATLLWGDRQDRYARQSLRQCLLSLHKELGPLNANVLKVGIDTVALDTESIVADVLRLSDLIESGEPTDLSDAISLYRGDFLEGLRIESERFQEWLGNRRAQFRSLAHLALQKIISGEVASGGLPAIAVAERLADADPLNEGAQRQLLILLWRYGGRDVALARAEEFLRFLHAEDAEAEPATTSLIGAMRHDSTTAETPPLPPPSPVSVATAQEPGTYVAAAAGPPRRRRALVVVGVGLIVALAVMGYSRRQFWPPWGPESSHDVDRVSASWRPPGILADVGVDQTMPAGSGISAVIVLPFAAVANGDGGGADRRLADRITDDLIADLSRLPQIRVIARQTAHFYGGQAIDAGALGSELGVRYVVDGTVQLQAQVLRIEASLVDTGTRLEVWSQRFQRSYDDRFAAQDELTNAIARALHLGVINVEDRRRPPGQRDPGVDDLLAHGWAAMANLVSLGTTSGADGYFEGALQRDPDNVSALIGLGGYHASVVAMFLVPNPDEHLQRGEALLQKAIEESPSSVMAYYYLGLVHKAQGRSQEALKDFTKVVREDPSLPLGYAQVGHLVSRMGRADEAMEYIRYAVRLNPKDPNMGLIGLMAGEIELERGHDQAALDWFKQSLALAPISPFAHAAMGAALALSGDASAAATQADAVRQLAPWLTVDQMIARLTATSQPGHEPARLIDGLRREFAAEH